MKNNNEEYKRFDSTMAQLIKIPHSAIKAKLDEEKRAKSKNKKKRKSARETD